MSASRPYRRPHYYQVDALYLLGKGEPMFYLSLSGRGVYGVLKNMKIHARGYQKFVAAYPSVCCEPLNSFYLFRKASGMLDEELLCDLLFSYGWQEANWGAWLAALAPHPVYAAHLERRLPTLPHGQPVLRLALAACGQPIPLEHSDAYAMLEEVRETLNRLPAQSPPLRRNPTAEQEQEYNRHSLLIRAAYRSGGFEAAYPLMSHGVMGYYHMSHAEWLAAGTPEAPEVPELPPVPRVRQLRHRVVPRF